MTRYCDGGIPAWKFWRRAQRQAAIAAARARSERMEAGKVSPRAVITDRRPFGDGDAWLPRRTLGDVLGEQDARREW